MNLGEVDGNNYKDEKDEWLEYVEQDVLCTAFFMLDIVKLWRKLLDFRRNILQKRLV